MLFEFEGPNNNASGMTDHDHNGDIPAQQNDISDDFCLNKPAKKPSTQLNELTFLEGSLMSSPSDNPNRFRRPGEEYHTFSNSPNNKHNNNNLPTNTTAFHISTQPKYVFQKEPESEPRLDRFTGTTKNTPRTGGLTSQGKQQNLHSQQQNSLMSVAQFEAPQSGIQSSEFYSRVNSNAGSEQEVFLRVANNQSAKQQQQRSGDSSGDNDKNGKMSGRNRNRSAHFMGSSNQSAQNQAVVHLLHSDTPPKSQQDDVQNEGESMIMMNEMGEDEKESVNNLFQSIEENQFQFFRSPTFKDNIDEDPNQNQDNSVQDRFLLSHMQLQPQSLTTLHLRNNSGGSLLSHSYQVEDKVESFRKEDRKEDEVKGSGKRGGNVEQFTDKSINGGSGSSHHYQPKHNSFMQQQQQQLHQKSDQKKVKPLNLAGLNAINEQYSVPQTEDRSQVDSTRTIRSYIEERKSVSKYVFNENEPMFSNAHAKTFIGSINQTLVVIKQLDRSMISSNTQSQMMLEYKQAIVQQRGNSPQERSPSLQLKADEPIQNYSELARASASKSSVTILDYFTTKQNIYIISEYLHEQCLTEVLKAETKQRMTQTQSAQILLKTLTVIDEQLNGKKTEHLCNLKLSNLFWNQHTKTLKIADFLPSYSLAKAEILTQLQQPAASIKEVSNVKSIGAIYFQLLCGTANSHLAQADFKVFQTHLNGENIPRQITEFLLKCIYIDTASMTDVRHYLSKYQHRLKQSTPTAAMTNSSIVSNYLVRPNFSGAIQNNLSPNIVNRTPMKIRSLATKEQTMILDDRQQSLVIASAFENNVSEHKKSTQKISMYLKKYGYTQSHTSFELKITHTKITSYNLNDERIENEADTETVHHIPIFRHSLEEILISKRKGNPNQINYNPKYSWSFLQEVDNLPYFETTDEQNRFNDSENYLHNSYERLFNHRASLMRCLDKKSNKNYFVKSIKVSDDQSFLEALKEIAIYKYIDHNFQVGLDIDAEEQDSPTKVSIQQKQQSVFEFGRNLEETQKSENGEQAGGLSLGKGYLEQLYQKADQEVQRQFEGGIHGFVDAYIIQRAEMEFCFVMVFEDAEFSLKDYLLKNSLNLEDNPDLDEIEEEQFLTMIKVVTKQIKRLKRIGIFHNNITPENILFQNTKSSRKRILISNFDAALLRKPLQSMDQFSSVFAKLPQHLFKYKSPEIRKMMEICMQEKETVIYNPIKADIFSLGICAMELRLREILQDSEVIPELEQLNQDTVWGDLLIGMTELSSSLRFSTKEVLEYIRETNLQKSTISYNDQPGTPYIPPSAAKSDGEHNQRNSQASNPEAQIVQQLLTPPPQGYRKQLPSIQLLQKDQPQFKNLHAKGVQHNVNKQDLFQYEERQMQDIREIDGDLQLLYQSRCARKIYLYAHALQIMESLELKYLKNKARSLDHNKLELLLLKELGSIYFDVFDISKSTDYFNRALAIHMKHFQEDTLAAAYLQCSLATLLLFDEQRNSNQMVVYLRQSLENYKSNLGNSSPRLVRVISMLADEYAMKGSYYEALHLYQECMIITNSFGYQGPQGIKLLDKLGWAFFQTSEYQSSLKFFLKSAQVKEKLQLTKDIGLAETYNNLAECYRILSVPSKAIYYYESSLNIIFELLAQLDKMHAMTQGSGSLLQSQTIQQTPRSIGLSHHNLKQLKAQVYNNLGIIYKSVKHYDKAIKLFNEAQTIRAALFGSNSFEATECLYNVAVMYDDQGRHTEAMAAYDQVIQQFKISKELDNSIYADCLQNKAISHYQINDFAKALSLLNDAMSIKRKKQNNSVSLAITLQNLALVYHKQGSYKKALQFYDEALKIFVKKLKPDHPHISTIQENMKQTQRFAK